MISIILSTSKIQGTCNSLAELLCYIEVHTILNNHINNITCKDKNYYNSTRQENASDQMMASWIVLMVKYDQKWHPSPIYINVSLSTSLLSR